MVVYLEEKKEDLLYRTFNENIKSHDLKWHCDKYDRIFKVLHETNWKFQYDNKLPINLIVSKEYFIPKKTFHRLIKGTGDLKIEIKEKF